MWEGEAAALQNAGARFEDEDEGRDLVVGRANGLDDGIFEQKETRGTKAKGATEDDRIDDGRDSLRQVRTI
jgi:hypothetical protein